MSAAKCQLVKRMKPPGVHFRNNRSQFGIPAIRTDHHLLRLLPPHGVLERRQAHRRARAHVPFETRRGCLVNAHHYGVGVDLFAKAQALRGGRWEEGGGGWAGCAPRERL